MNGVPATLLGITGLVAIYFLVSWMGGWDSHCDFSCWQYRVAFWR
jgi:hypothetical protein